MEPALHVLRPRPATEPIELTPAGRTMARALGWILLCGMSLALVWVVLPPGGDAAEAGMLAVVLAGCLFEKGDRELERLSRLLSERGFPGEPGDQQP